MIRCLAAYIAIGAPFVFIRDALLYWGAGYWTGWIGAIIIMLILAILREWGESQLRDLSPPLDTRRSL